MARTGIVGYGKSMSATALPGIATKPAASAAQRSRIAYVDALRVVLIMLVVAHHSLEAYAIPHPSEIPLPDPPIPRIWVFLWVNAAFFMGLFFFLGGYFTPGPADRKGIAAFARDRLGRIGLPLVFGTVFLVPLVGWAHLRLDPTMPPVGYWTYVTRDFLGFGPKPAFWPPAVHWPTFNFGHLWFLEHLLIYALLYSALRVAVPLRRDAAVREPPSSGAIAGYAIVLAAATFMIRIWYPQDRWIDFLGFVQMEPAHIAQYASLFVIGVIAGRNRWLETMPTRRGLIWLSIGGGLALAAYVVIGTGTLYRFNSRAWWVCGWECLLCTGLCVGLPVLLRELRLGAARLWQVLGANVLAVYVFHMPLVLLLQWALIDAPAAKWLRLVVTVVGAIVGTFAFTNWVVLRLPFARRVF
ncbi:MAG TPA: acyltransferase [Acetobacteraceae bacterium]|jgi:peptidoglycan/LPS O-acetylase OafA/YrhL